MEEKLKPLIGQKEIAEEVFGHSVNWFKNTYVSPRSLCKTYRIRRLMHTDQRICEAMQKDLRG